MGLHINIKKSKDLLEEKNENFSLDSLINSNYFISKLKEMLLKFIPQLNLASNIIIKICIATIKEFYFKLFDIKNEKLNEGVIDGISSSITGIKNIFKIGYNFLANIFAEEEQKENITVLNVSKEKINNLTNVIDNEEFKQQIDTHSFASISTDFEIWYHLMEQIPDNKAILIKKNDVQLIDSICKFEETKLFAIKNEDNYLCIPFNDESFDGFKAIKMTQYYKSFYQLDDQTHNDLCNIIFQFSEFYKKNKNFKKTKIFKYNDINIFFSPASASQKKDDIKGYYDPEDNSVHILYDHFKNFEINGFIATLIHEYIHLSDEKLNSKKFTNLDIQNLMNQIFELYGNEKIIDLNDLQSKLEIKNKSVFRYLISILQKHKFIDYYQKDYTKIIVLIDTKLGAKDDNEKHLTYIDVNYFNNPVELNTIIGDINSALVSNTLHAIFNNILFTRYIFFKCEIDFKKDIKLNINSCERIVEFVNKNKNNFQDILKQYENILNNVKNDKISAISNLSIFNNLEEKNLIDFLSKKPNDIIIKFIKCIFLNNNSIELILNIQRSFIKNDFKKMIKLMLNLDTFQAKIEKALTAVITDRFLKIYKRQFLIKNKNMSEEDQQKNIDKIEKDLKNNYRKKIEELIEDFIMQKINHEKRKEEKNNLELLDNDKNKANAQNKQIELQKNSLLRQYVSLLIH